MHLGDAATWTAAVGTVGALAFTAYTVRRQVDRERRADEYQRRLYARRVSLVSERGTGAVLDDGPDSIYEIGIYEAERISGKIIAHNGGLEMTILPGQKLEFTLIRLADIDASKTPVGSVCAVYGCEWI